MMHTLLEMAKGDYQVGYWLQEKHGPHWTAIQKGMARGPALTLVHFLNGGNLDGYGGVVWAKVDAE